MVQQGDFEVQLVEAATKVPFPEHRSKDGKHYVEVEPDAEYYIKICRTGSSHKGACDLHYYVDGQYLNFHQAFPYNTVESAEVGLWTYHNGLSMTKALKFSKPRMVPGSHSRSLSGKIEVQIYHGYQSGVGTYRDRASSFVTASADPNECGDSSKKKNLCSTEGSTSESFERRTFVQYTAGALLDTITLTYCSAAGLMEVGVLKKVPTVTPVRSKRARDDRTSQRQPKKIRVPNGAVGTYKEVELFDLTGDDDE